MILISGCSMSRNLAGSSAGSKHSVTDDFSEEGAPVQTASAASDGDAPPAQPGVKSSGGSGRKKLTGWMNKKDPKRESIPLERTDSSSSKDDDEVLADQGGLDWMETDSPMTADASKPRKSKGSAIDTPNPFDN